MLSGSKQTILAHFAGESSFQHSRNLETAQASLVTSEEAEDGSQDNGTLGKEKNWMSDTENMTGSYNSEKIALAVGLVTWVSGNT